MTGTIQNDLIECNYKALKSCQNLIHRKKIQSNIAEAHAQRGHERYKNGEYEIAIKEYYRARDNNAEHYPAIHQLGMCFLKQKNYKKARAHFKEIINRIHYSQIFYKASYIENFRDELEALISIADTYIQENIVGSLRKADEHIQLAKQLCNRSRRSFSEKQKQDIIAIEKSLQHQKSINQKLDIINESLIEKTWPNSHKLIEQSQQISTNHPTIIDIEQQLNHATTTKEHTKFTPTFFSKFTVESFHKNATHTNTRSME